MGSELPESVTFWLRRVKDGDAIAFQHAYSAAYAELKRLAHAQLRHNRGAADTTALVHEAYLKLCGNAGGIHDRHNLMGLAASAMRQVLVDLARRRNALKREGVMVTLHTQLPDAQQSALEILALDTSLDRLAKIDPRSAQLVELRYFGGYSEEETAAILGVTERTLRRDWRRARAFLESELTA